MTDNQLSYSAKAALTERVKELTCLYGIAQIAAQPDISLEEIVQGIVEILPPAWQYPEIALARIILDGISYTTQGFRECRQKQTAEITVDGVPRGVVDLVYVEEKPDRDEGPFLKEERNLIDAASLHAREIIRKLLVFARQAPPAKTQVNLNQVVEDGLYFFEARCAKEGIEIVRLLSPDLPEITADPAQLNQLLVNLLVNALQSMPGAGKITVQTRFCDHNVYLIVEDTGTGMSKEVLDKIFVPFFTTKDVGHGTGLGLIGFVFSRRAGWFIFIILCQN